MEFATPPSVHGVLLRSRYLTQSTDIQTLEPVSQKRLASTTCAQMAEASRLTNDCRLQIVDKFGSPTGLSHAYGSEVQC